MSLLKWEAKYEMGVAEIDNQHKKWLDILNRFYDGVSKGDLKEKMLLLIDEALKYTRFHFQEEEKFMEKIKFPHLDEQKKMHKDIISTLTRYKNDITNNKNILSMTITTELKKWFKEHILVEDMKYADYFKKKH